MQGVGKEIRGVGGWIWVGFGQTHNLIQLNLKGLV